MSRHARASSGPSGNELRLVKNSAGFSEVADLHEHFAEISQQLEPHRILLLK